MSGKKPYYGAARFVEIAPPGIAHRILANADHITSITFSQAIDDDQKVTGFKVVIGVGGTNNEFTFNQLEVAILFYNELLNDIQSLNIPCTFKTKLKVPPEVSKPLNADGVDIDDDYVLPDLDDTDDLDDPESIISANEDDKTEDPTIN